MTLRKHSQPLLVMVSLALGVIAACNDRSPTSPRPPREGGAPTGTVARVELLAPQEIAPGESVQLTANATRADGSVHDVSSTAHWISGTPTIVEVSATGKATGRSPGEVFVTANSGGVKATARIFVLPKSTFRLSGSIKDRDTGAGIAGVTVTATGRSLLTSTSGVDGSYVFYGVAGVVTVNASKAGYLSHSQNVSMTEHRSSDVDLIAEGSRGDYRGTYRLTISATECLTSLRFPEAAMRRIYTASVAQDGATLAVTLSDADLVVDRGYGNRFFGVIGVDESIAFSLNDESYGYDGSAHVVVERFAGGIFYFQGTVSARGTPQRLAGTFNGSFNVTNQMSPFNNNWCDSNAHAFEMVRR